MLVPGSWARRHRVFDSINQFDRNGLLVPPAGVEPALANYLLHTGYKSAVLPLNYRGMSGVSDGIRTHAYRNHNPRS